MVAQPIPRAGGPAIQVNGRNNQPAALGGAEFLKEASFGFMFMCRGALLLLLGTQSMDQIVEPVPDRRIAHAKEPGHFLEAAAGQDEVSGKELIIRGKASQRRQRELPVHFRFAGSAAQAGYGEVPRTTGASGGQDFHEVEPIVSFVNSLCNKIQQ